MLHESLVIRHREFRTCVQTASDGISLRKSKSNRVVVTILSRCSAIMPVAPSDSSAMEIWLVHFRTSDDKCGRLLVSRRCKLVAS
jgi:hypothetical protein